MERFRKLAGTPGSDGLNSCPTIIGETDNDRIIVQGQQLDDETRRALNIPDGEDAVIVPRDLYLRGADRLMEDG